MMLGQAALAMWWDVAAPARAEFEDWHTHEHFPERLAVPGFRRASRWSSSDGGEGVFIVYELADHDVLSSPAYLARLNAPTPWSTRMMPHHRNMVRSQCRVLQSRGAVVAREVLTVRLSPAPGRDSELRAGLRSLGDALVPRPGVSGIHLLKHVTPEIAPTEEQRIRGWSDKAADWVLLAVGYEPAVLRALQDAEFGEAGLASLGAEDGSVRAIYTLSCAATATDVA